MKHEELQAQYEKDRGKYGADAFKFWEYKYSCDKHFSPLNNTPAWEDIVEYRRIEPIAEPVFIPEEFSGLNWRDAERLIGKVVEAVEDPDYYPWIKSCLEDIRDISTVRKFKIAGDNYFPYIRTCPETYAQPTSKNFKLHDTVLVYDRYRFAVPLKAEIVELSSSNDGVRLLLHESNHSDYPKGCSTVWVHDSQLRKIDSLAHPTITIGGVKLPRPEVEAPKYCTKYWVWSPTGGLNRTIWQDSVADQEWLKAKIIHLTESRAQEWADWWQSTVIKAR